MRTAHFIHAITTVYSTTPDVSSPPSVSEIITCSGSDAMKAIKHLKHNTASGPDGLSSTILKGCHSSICSRLACFFNTSFSSGKVLSAWNTSNVIPSSQEGDASLVQNYRLISLLMPLVGNLLERLIQNVLLDHLLG